MLAVIVGAGTLASGYARAKAGGGPVPKDRVTTARLALLQVSAFVGLEFVERVVSGVPFHHFLLPVLVAGALAQILIAAVGATLIGTLYRMGEAVARVGVPDLAAAAPRIWIPAGPRHRSGRTPHPPQPSRGPPLLLLQAS